MQALLLATTNRHKLEEYRAIFSDLPFTLLSLYDVHLDIHVEEIGTTSAENAELKARAYAQAGSIDQSRHYYDEFLRLWDHADPSLPALRQARAERSKLGLAGPMTARKSE